jgi:hypothetical protein
MKQRCAPYMFLFKASQDRKPILDRLPSVTEILSPFRYTYLKQKYDYAEMPKEMIFKIHGSAAHYFLEDEEGAVEHIATELSLTDKKEKFKGTIDCYDFTRGGVISDYKFLGKYKIGTYLEDFNKNALDYKRQINGYRILLEDNDYSVSGAELNCFCRDFRGYEHKQEVANQGKVYKTGNKAGQPYPKPVEPFYCFPVELYDRNEFREFFYQRIEMLMHYLREDIMPPVCEDRWGDKKCKGYCPPNEYCDYYVEKYGEEKQ